MKNLLAPLLRPLLAAIKNALGGFSTKPVFTEKRQGAQYTMALARERRRNKEEVKTGGVLVAEHRHDEARRKMGIDDSHNSFSSHKTA